MSFSTKNNYSRVLIVSFSLSLDVGFMLSLGCIQALKCNSNKCPTGIATTNKDLMEGLDPEDKALRVYNFHKRTVMSALDIIGAMGHERVSDVTSDDIMRRGNNDVRTLSERFPSVEPNSLLEGKAPERLQTIWDECSSHKSSSKRWIY